MHTDPQKQQWLLSRWSEALATEAFKSRQIHLGHLADTLELSTRASFQRLVQALLREGLLNPQALRAEGLLHWLTLTDGARLCFEGLIPARMNSWDIRGSITLHRSECPAQKLLFPSQLLSLLSAQLDPLPSPEVLARVAEELDDSFCNATLCQAFHHGWSRQLREQFKLADDDNLLTWLKGTSSQPNPTSVLEQWGTLGHPWHPNYKTKLGLSPTEVIAFSPEFEACVPVVLCALHRQWAHVESLSEPEHYRDWWQGHFPLAAEQLIGCLRASGLDPDDYLPLPVHPWQAAKELPRSFAREIADRLLVVTTIIAFNGQPTMSFRTLAPNAGRCSPMVKLPVALRLTSVQRTLSPRSARMGPRVSSLVLRILKQEPQVRAVLNIVPERIGVHYAPQPPDDQRSRHLAVLYRDDPSSVLQPGEMAVPVGSLFALDEHGQPLLRQWVRLAQGGDSRPELLRFFRDYLSIAVPGLLGIYLIYGVAFEAHQQNSFMIMSTEGQLSRLMVRDFGDIRIHRQTLHRQGLDLQLHDPQMTLYDDADFVRDKLLHTTFMCHLGELVLLCARHWKMPEEALWNELAIQVSDCFDNLRERVEPQRWAIERLALLEQDWPAKSFLRMRLLDSTLDIVGRLNNPLRLHS
ncbi:siderophore synthetase [Pseudomonas frederiksbergensis]|uniref:Siderophore synthetase n=1 Tax=Pseudomonas frederiksbergensis TaxID=104087 RepID=A0A1J0EQ44_9PSED|nr:IucA/IucC family protein [Pseudomonas frederiksbergensis]APC17944.1 siderophore synthetase [Pseudomonas frederiksbergensis]